jgi:hypothetical protein
LFVVSILAGRIADFALDSGINKTTIRKVAQCTACMIPALFLGLICLEADRKLAVACIITAVAAGGLSVSGAGANSLDIAPTHAGIILG